MTATPPDRGNAGGSGDSGDSEGPDRAAAPPARILLLVENRTNRRLLAERLADHGTVTAPAAPTAETIGEEPFDLAVIDDAALARHGAALAERKGRAAPDHLPFLYLAAPADGRDRGVGRAGPAPGALWERVDDVARRPVDSAELDARVASLLAVRRRAARLASQNDRLADLARTLAHDLRGPLNAARGNLSLLAEAGAWDAERGAVVDRSLDRMEELIEDALAVARGDGLVGSTEPVSLPAVATRAWETAGTDAATLVVGDDLGWVRADESRLRELLENLFRNSVEHSSTGSRPPADDSVEHGSTGSRTASGDSVEHGSTSSRPPTDDSVKHGAAGGRLPADDGAGGAGRAPTVRVVPLAAGFAVEDDGPGLPAELRDRAFEAGATTVEGGTGLGLPIVERIAGAHGWTVAATEGTDGGARFEVTGVGSAPVPHPDDRVDP